ncbi:MAG: GH92 family glycosyl hydrolase [Bacteroidales bacterium]|jgi:predicted alpha-1,2-mannosidase|nr:GH92 family glycosyl hydrolase [Bacteroidales bacterium]
MQKSLVVLFLSVLYQSVSAQNLTQYVKPIIGTQRMGHTYPGATVPFGMVQLSPDTDTIPYAIHGSYNPKVYEYCAGYQYDDKTIVGFSHTHFNGTGHSDLGDFLIMPTTGTLRLNPGTADNPESGFRTTFSHENEIAEAGYYKVLLDDYAITAELTATERVGMHRYTFPETKEAHIIFDLMHGIYNYPDKNVWTFVRIENDTLITGYRQTNGWARTRTLYFAMSFSKPFKNYGAKDFEEQKTYRGFWRKFDQEDNFPDLAGRQLRIYFDFDMTEGEQLAIKFALSPVSAAGALKNMEQEIPHWDFERVKREARDQWEKELSRITVTCMKQEDYESFYTAIYHAFITPTLYMDVDGKYKGLDQNIHQAEEFTNYTTFSLWDTYRALHPFLNLIQTGRNNDMIKSMLAHYNQSVHHILPIWSHHANENWCMIGYHAVPVIADAIGKGEAQFDVGKALEACISSAKYRRYDGLNYYMDLGYVPEDKSGSSVSKTLEYAYDDWCIAQIAKKLDKKDIYNEFIQRSENYVNVFDPTIGFMRPKLSNGTWKKDFDPLDTHGQGFIEGNAWNYSLYVPHQPEKMIEMMGGKERFVGRLDSLFTMHLPDKYFENTEDITRDGIIGNYVHGNEPSHHIPFLFNYCENPHKTQEIIRMVMQKMYKSAPDGLGGNDDCGQMSAWYIFNSLGFYPFAPASDSYQIGSPLVKSATLHLENGNIFEIEVKNQSEENIYVKEVWLNEKKLTDWELKHKDIMQGGKLVFVMTNIHN